MKMHQRLLFLAFAVTNCSSGQTTASTVKVEKSENGWRLLVDGDPYFVKGMCYSPTKVGEDPNQGSWRDWMIVDEDNDGRIDAPYQSWVDRNRNNAQDPDEPAVGDFRLLQQMGCNTIRVYHHASARPEVQALYRGQAASSLLYSHSPNKALLRELFKTYGIRVAMGDLLGAYTVGSGATWDAGTDYQDPVQQARMLRSVEAMVREFKDEPFLLLWILGNENNFERYTHTNAVVYPEAYAKFVNRVAKRIHKLDPAHPVVLCNGETHLIRVYAKYAPEIDIFGVNSYRTPGFGTLWQEVAREYGKPVLLSEFGTSHPKVENGLLDEKRQAEVHRIAWRDIQAHAAGGKQPGNSLGGFVYEWLDNWWQDGNPYEHNLSPDGWHHEWNGIASQGDGRHSTLLRQLRAVYFMYQKSWR